MLELVKTVTTSDIAQALIIYALTFFAGNVFTRRGRLAWAISHQHHFAVPLPGGAAGEIVPIRTQEIWFENIGRTSIDEIEIILNQPPLHFEIWMPREHTRAVLPDNRLSLKIPNLSGRESFILSVLNTAQDLPLILTVRWRDGVARQLPMAPRRVWPRWVHLLSGALALLGITTIIYGLLQLGLWLWALSQVMPVP